MHTRSARSWLVLSPFISVWCLQVTAGGAELTFIVAKVGLKRDTAQAGRTIDLFPRTLSPARLYA